MARKVVRKQCANCVHHISLHQYGGSDQHAGPGKCRGENCPCTTYRQPKHGERIPNKGVP